MVIQGPHRGKAEGADKRRRTDGRDEDESEWHSAEKRESGSGKSAMGTLTSGGDMTRHGGSAQLGQRSVLPCCSGRTRRSLTHIHRLTGRLTNPVTPRSPAHIMDTHSVISKRAQAHTPNAMVLAKARQPGEALD